MVDAGIVVIGALSILVIILLALSVHTRKTTKALWTYIKQLEQSKKSLSATYGKISEQFMPFIKDYPYDPQQFRFLGTPVDGVQFEKDKIIFVEFKTNSSHLSAKQREIRDTIKRGRVTFMEFSLKNTEERD